MGLKFMLYNVHSLNSSYKCSLMWRDVLKIQAKIISLQETHLVQPDVPCLKHKSFPHIFHSTLHLKKAGTAILIKNLVAFQLKLKRSICNSFPYTLVSLYAPNTRQLPFLRSVIMSAKRLAHGRLLIAEDFNTVVDKSRHRSMGCARSAFELQSLLNEEHLHNIWRYQHASE